jgi:hypothetical protein
MTDNQVEMLMRERGLKIYPSNVSDIDKLWGNYSDRSFMIDLERL